MIQTGSAYLLFMEPRHGKSAHPIDDALTKAMIALLRTARKEYTLGIYACTGCGAAGDAAEYYVKHDGPRMVTHNLAAHYLAWHRAEVPAGEIAKLQALIDRHACS